MNTKLNIEVPESFFNEEVRAGYTVTRERKELWAVLLDLAVYFEKCVKSLGLKYWADGGTGLGTLRHQGFVPWDDDMDFGMMREDYEILKAHCRKFNTEDYIFKVKARKLILKNPHAEINNGKGNVLIDIFPFDYVPDLNMIANIKATLRYWRERTKSYWDSSVQKEASKIIESFTTYAPKSLYVANTGIGRGPMDGRLLKDIGECNNRMKFEFLELNVPDNLEGAVVSQYGKDWKTPVQGTALHTVYAWKV